MKDKEKVISILKFLKELGTLKNKTISNITKQPWTLFLDMIPNNNNIHINYRDSFYDEDDEIFSSALLTIHKPEFVACPKPAPSLLKWINDGWERFDKDVEYIRQIFKGTDENGDTVYEMFEDSSTRVNLYNKWLENRKIWVKEQKSIDTIRDLFLQLYQLNQDLQQNAESFELMVGNGMLIDRSINDTYHPILVKRVKIEFNPQCNEISICDTDTDSELYTMLLSCMDLVNHSTIQVLQNELNKHNYHPLDRNDTYDFLKIAIHNLCAESQFIPEKKDIPQKTKDKIFMQIRPVFFLRKKLDGLSKFVDSMIDNIEDTGFVPRVLENIVGSNKSNKIMNIAEPTLEQALAEVGGEDIDILLAKPANKEQLEIARQIERNNAVLVQGPPGTGKTHTIANLMGHFLAKGNSILVTSYTSKALSVLKEKLPEPLQSLCVSVLDDSNGDMEHSINGIIEYISRYTANELKRKVDNAKKNREEIIKKLSDVRKKIYTIKFKEYMPLVFNGESLSPVEVAQFVRENTKKLSYIPGKVSIGAPLPLSFDELSKLYQSNIMISLDEETELEQDLPNISELTSPEQLRKWLDDSNEIKEKIRDIGNKIGKSISIENVGLLIKDEKDNEIQLNQPQNNAVTEMMEYLNEFNTVDDWLVTVVVDGKRGGGVRQRWEKLRDSIINTCKFANDIIAKQFGQEIKINLELKLLPLEEILNEMKDLYLEKGKIPWYKNIFNNKFKQVSNSITINGKTLISAEDCSLVLDYLKLEELRKECGRYWNELMKNFHVPRFEELGDGREPELTAKHITEKITRYLDWYENEFDKLKYIMQNAGINPNEVFVHDDFTDDINIIKQALIVIRETLPSLATLQNLYVQLKRIQIDIQIANKILEQTEQHESVICCHLREAWRLEDVSAYAVNYHKLERLCNKYTVKNMRQEYLQRLYQVAPVWADSIRNRIGIFGKETVPEYIEDAWKWKQYSQMLEEITKMPFEDLQQKNLELSKDYRAATAKLAEYQAWYHLLRRTEENSELQQNLMGWKLITKKLGRGTGKRAPKYRAEAKKLMSKCQKAVPAWIMTTGFMMNNLVPGKNLFDVMIVDEASQADITILSAMYLAKKVIIVGDDKQVSPMAVGMELDSVDALAEMYIKDKIPNWSLYTGNTSLYDIALTICQPLMLHEHFRCVPDIIGFCNKLCYDNKIKPLRDVSDCKLTPSVINYRVVDGQRSGNAKINEREAEAIVGLIRAMVDIPEYDAKTIGVISLLGNEQAKLINRKLMKDLDITTIDERRILCGDASQFQGDERDVILLSLVDSNDKETPLRLVQATTGDIYKRYNVAVSRARDQLWIVNSLDVSKDLKTNDIRKIILDYANNPHTLTLENEKIAKESESPFEEAVAKSLVLHGYQIVQQWSVGAYRIDMVVIDGSKKVALECDGERYHSGEEKIQEDMERQTILERLGWRFIRIRGSEFYSDAEATIQRVIRDLNEMEIYPNKNQYEKQDDTELLKEVKRKYYAYISEKKEKKGNTIQSSLF